ncbi:E3 ubiquitin-protein ligase RHA1B-like [Quillaja saponaria]|uniref:E3 ubiquitin-protein ligase RHA1B-like n=1 Tax=Quillaja saponaria TaxID=32244 RepID=A0AAD7P7G1_QUISA|nr:E3 ubiquitin-protein ligase RHA1B-like [Quillaja saponaria]
MGFPSGYSDLFLPKLFILTLSILGFIRKLISTLFRYLGLHDFLEPDITSWPEQPPRIPEFHSISALLISEFLPVVKFSELVDVDPHDSCAVCLYEFEAHDAIRWLTNCGHIFHRGCVDRWMGYDQKTCPLCRTRFIPEDMQGSFKERLWVASEIPEFYEEYS